MKKDKLINTVHKIAEEKDLPFNAVLTYYFMEEMLRTISKTKFRDNFIFKGGFIISNVVGIAQRTTVDIDMLINGIPINEKNLSSILEEIFKIRSNECISSDIKKIEKIRIDDRYGGYRIVVQGQIENIRVNVPLDIATGDPLTPGPVLYKYKPLFSNKPINISSYNLETILAEKIETIYRKGIVNSRTKDLYDLYIIYKLHYSTLNINLLMKSCNNTFRYRNTELNIDAIKNLLNELKYDEQQKRWWDNFIDKNRYAKGISFENVVNACIALIEELKNV